MRLINPYSMAQEEEKAKRLKEIQDRLAEIQSRSSKTPTKSDKKATAPNSVAQKKSESIEKNTSESNSTKPTPSSRPSIEKKTATPTTPSPTIHKTKPFDKEPKKDKKLNEEDSVKWKSNQLIDKDKKIKNQPKKEIKQKSGKLSKVYTWISLTITLAIIGYFIYSFFIRNSTQENIITTTSIPVDSDVLGENKPIEVDVIEEILPDEPKSNEEEIVEETSPKVVQSREQPSRISKPPVEAIPKKSNPAINKTKAPSGFIISYVSNSTESAARNNVVQLSQKGFSANYYYMPDHNSKNPKLYKVYLGPFSSESDAFPTFKKVVAFNDKAFILKMN